tara:strand:+ start:11450 stop:11638 length:189 start_codon:yes stop_codon:yes gene_type:complete
MNDSIASRIKDAVEISIVNGGAVMFSTIAQVEQGLRILSLILAVTYTAIRLFQLITKKKTDG